MCFVCAVLFFFPFFLSFGSCNVFNVPLHSACRLIFPMTKVFTFTFYSYKKNVHLVLFTVYQKRKNKIFTFKIDSPPISTYIYRLSNHVSCALYSGIRHNTKHSILYYILYQFVFWCTLFIWNVVFLHLLGNRRAQMRSV